MAITATQIITGLTILQALAPTIDEVAEGLRDMLGKDVDIKAMTVDELVALKAELQATELANWPELQFESGKE